LSANHDCYLVNGTYLQEFKQFDDEVSKESKSLDNLMKSLGHYYKDIKTKCHLNLVLHMGFHHDSELQHHLKPFIPPRNNSLVSTTSYSGDVASHSSSISSPTIDLNTSTTHSISNNTFMMPIPILQSVDKPSTSLPSPLTFTEDIIRVSIGFHHIDTNKTDLKDLHQDTIYVTPSQLMPYWMLVV